MNGFLGGLRERLKWWVAPAEMRRLEWIRVTLAEYRQWLAEFPDIATTLENFSVDAWSLVPTLNAGSPARENDGPWTVRGLREVLRRRHVTDAPPTMLPCAARAQGTAGGNVAADCDWPFCGCDPHADRVIAALEECGVLNERRQYAHAVDHAVPGTDRTIFGYQRPRPAPPMPPVKPWPGVDAVREGVAAHYRKGDARVFMRLSGICTVPPVNSCYWPECGCSSNERRWNKGCVQGLGVPPKPPAPPAAKRAPDEESNVSPHLAVLNPRCAAWPGCACAWNQPCVNLSPAPS